MSLPAFCSCWLVLVLLCHSLNSDQAFVSNLCQNLFWMIRHLKACLDTFVLLKPKCPRLIYREQKVISHSSGGMPKSTVPIFGLVRNLLCPHKAKYGKATCHLLHETSFIRVVNSGTRPHCLFKAPFLFSILSTPGFWRELTFNMDFGRDWSFSGTPSWLYNLTATRL